MFSIVALTPAHPLAVLRGWKSVAELRICKTSIGVAKVSPPEGSFTSIDRDCGVRPEHRHCLLLGLAFRPVFSSNSLLGDSSSECFVKIVPSEIVFGKLNVETNQISKLIMRKVVQSER